MYKIVLLLLLLLYETAKFRLLPSAYQEPKKDLVLFPRQDARFAHISMTLLQAIFVLEFISHTVRDGSAVQRLVIVLVLFVAVDVLFWLKLKNTSLTYDDHGVVAENFLGMKKKFAWDDIIQVRSSAVGLHQSRFYVLKTCKGTVKVSERSPGLDRFRRVLEEKL